MSTDLEALVADYLRVRRALGFKLKSEQATLAKFLAYLQDQGASTITVEHALGFATSDPGLCRRGQALRMSAIRCFTRWAVTIDPTIAVPPARLLPARPTRSAPFIYTTAQIDSLLAAAGGLEPPMRAASMRTLIGLMAATGIRTGEALGLAITDWDRGAQVLEVTGKYSKTRVLPVHPTVAVALGSYLDLRERLGLIAGCPTLLVSVTGRQLRSAEVHPTFQRLARQAGLRTVSPACRPRLHDLRHTFAVNTMLDAYRTGNNPAVVLALLSTWLGHADPSDTYWYLTGTAELMTAAHTRLEQHAQEAGPQPSGTRS